MKKIAIIAVVEPLSFSLNESTAWTLTTTLKAPQNITLVDSSNAAIGSMVGISPLLQPVRMALSGGPAFLLVMRAVLNAAAGFKDEYGTGYTLKAAGNSRLGEIFSSMSQPWHATPFLLISPRLSVAAEDVAALGKYVDFLTSTLWQNDPISWTSHKLQLASDGQFMTSAEMLAAGLVTGITVINGGSLSLIAGAKPSVVSFSEWQGAGLVKAAALTGASDSDSASSSCADTVSSSDSGGVGDGDGDGYIGDGDGGDGDGGS